MSDTPAPLAPPAPPHEDHRSETLLHAQKQSLEMVVRGAPLPQVMTYLTKVVEDQAGRGVICSIVSVDADSRLHTLAAPNLPDEYNAAVDTLVAAPGVGCCPAVAASGEPVVTADIANHPNWAGHAEAPLALGLRGAWSQPILSREGRVLGAFATYFREAREPSSMERRLVETLSQTAALAIERAATEAQMEQRRRELDLALEAADMGSWRYRLDDNLCEYSPRAQRLYGLSQRLVLYDRDTLNDFFHPDDRDRMRRAASRAIDPAGNGRYVAEYRVRHEGGWRWLSSWGATEFDETFTPRRAIAIVGASRDVTARKQAEEHQRLMVNELNHRVKNTLATVQSIIAQTLRTAPDAHDARDRIEARILSLARAHDILTTQAWSGADMAEVVARALEPFQPPTGGEVCTRGGPLRLSPQQALALAMAIHELATNAVKYGALSRPGGKVMIEWDDVEDEGVRRLAFRWREVGGPPVTPPTRRGFGARLLERGLASEFGGVSRIDYAPEGVAFELTGRL